MARVKLGGLAQDVRGSLNGTVFSRNRGGAYVRSKVSPVQPPSVNSSAVRAAFKANSQRWAQVLTDGQRAGWVAFAAVHPFVNVFGDSNTLSGIAMYGAVNQRVQLCGGTFIDDAPASFVVDDLGDILVVCTAVSHVLALTLTCANPPAYYGGLYVFLTPPVIGSATSQKSDYRLVNHTPRAVFSSGVDFGPDVQDRFPLVEYSAGQKFGCRVAPISLQTGAIGPGRYVPIVVA